jgi:hypothetical protein
MPPLRPPEAYAGPRVGASSAQQTAGKVLLLVVLLGGGWWLYAHLMSPSTPGAQRQGLGDMVAASIRSPDIVVDEEVAVGPEGSQARGFTIPSARPVEVVADGTKHADKGFTVYVIASNEWDNFKAGKTFAHIPSFDGLKVRSFKHTEVLPPGSWTVVVKNSENFLNTMVVHLRITVDPS